MRIGVAGLGLIGGSLALALRERHDVTGYDADARVRSDVARSGLRVVTTVEELVPADAILVATPLPAVVPTLERLAARADGAVLIDTASLKREVAEYAVRAPRQVRIVGGHPMAGSTSSGFSAADPELFRDRAFLLVPTARSDEAAMAIAGAIVRDCGAVVTVCSAEAHDRAMARLSAAPLAAAVALAMAAADVDSLLATAGPGFRDSTRLAETPPEFAVELLFGNAPEAEAAIRSVSLALEQLAVSLERGDREYVRTLLVAAARVRGQL